MENLAVRMDLLREMVLCVYGLCSTACKLDSFEPVYTNAANGAVMFKLVQLDEDIRRLEKGKLYDPNKLYFYSNSMGMIWLFNVDQENIYLIGPAFTDEYSVMDVLDKLDQYKISKELKLELATFIKQIPVLSWLRMWDFGSLQYCCLTGKKLATTDIVYLDTRKSVVLPSAEPSQTATGNYINEQRIWKIVREGNVDAWSEIEGILTNITFGKVSDGKMLRQEKNIAIINAALCCRSAVEGGLSPEIAYALSDQYIQRIESTRNMFEISEICVAMIDNYIRRVHQIKLQTGISPTIAECCDYLNMHPELNPDLQMLAEKYGYTPYYFSKKFKEETGYSVRDYVMLQKVEKAKLLLREGVLSISDISEQLGFTTQSYFGRIFRKITSLSPTEFRDQGYSQSKNET